MNSFRSCSSHRAFALVVVLGVMALVVVLIVGFLSRATTERTAAAGFAASVSSSQLADVAVSVVQTQINDATTQGVDVAWVSQPGMVRTFVNAGRLKNAYKLYSADKMISNSVNPSDDLPADFTSSPAIWVDLNAPMTANGIKIYPIMDPAAAQTLQNDAGKDVDAVEGFECRSAATNQPAPMPVRWLYMLQSGTLVAPTGSGSSAEVSGASASNPIVGRVAFWTDDDTCKVNINTAGGGVNADDTYWDIPRSFTQTDVEKYANCQPVAREFQRYPGHPGSVMLSAIFPGLSGSDYMNITPRMSFGGSQGGAVSVDNVSVSDPISSPPKSDRLYTSVGELMFDKSRKEQLTLSQAILKSRRFFLTAHSRAPEVNLFNLPRIAIWPVYQLNSDNTVDLNHTTAFDRAIAFCSSTGTTGNLRSYFFQRKMPLDPACDISISRNADLYRYLQNLTNRDIPGFGGRFATKYTVSKDQILTEIFDYIRITNLNDDLLSPSYRYTTGTNSSSDANFATVVPTQPPTVSPAAGTFGMGRWLTPAEFIFVFSCCASGTPYIVNGTPIVSNTSTNLMLKDPIGTGTYQALESNEKRIQVGFIPLLYGVAGGWKQMFPAFRMQVEGMDKLTLSGASLHFPASAYVSQTSSAVLAQGCSGYGGLMGQEYLPKNKNAPIPNPTIQSTENNYPFVSWPVTVNVSAGSMIFSGGDITVKFFALDSSGACTTRDPIQTLKLKVPAIPSLPIPDLNTTAYPARSMNMQSAWSWYTEGYDGSGSTKTKVEQNKNAGRLNTVRSFPPLIFPGDVVRGILVNHADYRIAAGMPLVDDWSASSAYFGRHSQYLGSSKIAASGIAVTPDAVVTGAFQDASSKYVSTVTGSNAFPLGIPARSASDNAPDASSSGDFDTANSVFEDGAYINKPDEGTIQRISTASDKLAVKYGKGVPYFSNFNTGGNNPTFFSPNRIISSPVMFGSLPTGINPSNTAESKPWQTLLFRPLAASESTHVGATSPADHLLLDLFWMPVVEPYAISDRFSTAGKINMNYQIIPFTYITRSSGIRAVLKSEKLVAIENNRKDVHRSPWYDLPSTYSDQCRFDLDLEKTIQQFEDRFANGNNVFISPSEICSLYMIPQGQTVSAVPSWWDNHRQTGDNVRERIYATMYSKLTTKSNTFTVHFRAQSLKKSRNTSPNTWIEGRDSVVGEYRGSTTLERYIDTDADIPDYARNPDSRDTLDKFYKWRIIENRQFAP